MQSTPSHTEASHRYFLCEKAVHRFYSDTKEVMQLLLGINSALGKKLAEARSEKPCPNILIVWQTFLRFLMTTEELIRCLESEVSQDGKLSRVEWMMNIYRALEQVETAGKKIYGTGWSPRSETEKKTSDLDSSIKNAISGAKELLDQGEPVVGHSSIQADATLPLGPTPTLRNGMFSQLWEWIEGIGATGDRSVAAFCRMFNLAFPDYFPSDPIRYVEEEAEDGLSMVRTLTTKSGSIQQSGLDGECLMSRILERVTNQDVLAEGQFGQLSLRVDAKEDMHRKRITRSWFMKSADPTEPLTLSPSSFQQTAFMAELLKSMEELRQPTFILTVSGQWTIPKSDAAGVSVESSNS